MNKLLILILIACFCGSGFFLAVSPGGQQPSVKVENLEVSYETQQFNKIIILVMLISGVALYSVCPFFAVAVNCIILTMIGLSFLGKLTDD